ncbi:conserved hypothetical protein [Tenacibaculum maritimum]|uniref:hypothetical protein n=1 Tax=Tenacibaculum maritimum TaxID=107401 RepID=UPI0012E45BFB|nr:hypothetical protein [Tenacibaculum maritimum]CAA0247824.1 conserved hypothetical protein [Tenacibaculum maritimum]
MAYKYHPEIEGLKVNEDGTEVFYNGEPLKVGKLKRKERESDMLYLYFQKRTFSLAKIICECWHGMAENPRWVSTRKEKAKGFHYTNLSWEKRGKNPEMGSNKIKRSSLSKLSPADIESIKNRIKKGDVLKEIAKDYDTSEMSISRIKKRMLND